jgi:hypothetical protein
MVCSNRCMRPQDNCLVNRHGGRRAHADGLVSQVKLGRQASYSVFQTYKRFGNHWLAANSDEASVSLCAAKKDDGGMTVVFVNRGAAPVTTPLQVQQGEALKLSEADRFDKDHQSDAFGPPAFKNGCGFGPQAADAAWPDAVRLPPACAVVLSSSNFRIMVCCWAIS